MLASTSAGLSGRPTASFGFSRQREMRSGRAASISMTPNWSDCASGWRMAATVQPTPDSMCASTICEKSMRYTWSAPTTTT